MTPANKMMNISALQDNALLLRKEILHMCYASKAGHVGGSLSAIDILNVLYNHVLRHDPSNPQDPNRDRFVLSKGHVAEALFATLAYAGYFDAEELQEFSRPGSRLIGHPNNKIEGIDVNTGSLGHGLPVAVGMALAAKMDDKDTRIYCLMGDGEQAEGSIWEAAMAAGHYQLDNLTAILDRNGLQISGSTEEVMGLKDVKAKYESFGFHVVEADGHNYAELIDAFEEAKNYQGKPTLILAHTIKGKGVDFMENEASWHHGVLNEEQYDKALAQIEGQKGVC